MTEIPDICIFMHRLGPIHAEQMASIAQHTREPFNLLYHFGPGTAHANMNKCLDRATSRYVVILDDDVVFGVDGWLSTLIHILKTNPRIGLLTPCEIQDASKKYIIEARPLQHAVRACTWCPGYVMAVDRSRVPNLRADENIPGPSGMSDVDLSMQVRAAGYLPALTNAFSVLHPEKPKADDWRRQHQIVLADDLYPLHVEQVNYMKSKWGDLFLNNQTMRQTDELETQQL